MDFSKQLSHLASLEVLKYMEASKRLELTTFFPRLEKIEKSVPLKIDYLDLRQSEFTINKKRFFFGKSEFCENNRKRNGNLKNGGNPWRFGENQKLSAGDIFIARENQYYREVVFEEQEVIEKCRKYFLVQFEARNPMEMFSQEEKKFEIAFRRFFKKIHRDSRNYFSGSRPAKRKGFKNSDSLFLLFPNQLKKMLETLEELKRNISKDDLRIQYLEKLIYPPEKFKLENRLTIFVDGKFQSFHRVEDIRKSYKELTTRYFGSRKSPIYVDFLKTWENCGIIGLPKTFSKFMPRKWETFHHEKFENIIFGPYKPVIDSTILEDYSVYGSSVPLDKICQNPIIHQFKHLEVALVGGHPDMNEMRNVHHLKSFHVSLLPSSCDGVLEWMRIMTDKNIGQKLTRWAVRRDWFKIDYTQNPIFENGRFDGVECLIYPIIGNAEIVIIARDDDETDDLVVTLEVVKEEDVECFSSIPDWLFV